MCASFSSSPCSQTGATLVTHNHPKHLSHLISENGTKPCVLILQNCVTYLLMYLVCTGLANYNNVCVYTEDLYQRVVRPREGEGRREKLRVAIVFLRRQVSLMMTV